MAELKKIYSDLDLKFDRQPMNSDVSLVYDNRSVINSVRNLLLTNYYERLWQPTIGSNLTGMLFEPVNSSTASTLETEITNTIQNFEPRVLIDEVIVTPSVDESGYNITLKFFIGNDVLLTQVEFFLERIR